MRSHQYFGWQWKSMAFVRTKTIKGHEYQYLVENFREGDKTKQRVVKYLGRKGPKS